MDGKQRLMLIDGHAMAYRAYFATPPLTAPNGEPTNAVFGFASMLLKAIADEKPDYVVATFDSGKTFRHEEYTEYKATRAKMPPDLAVQVSRIEELTQAMGIPVETMEGYEADDLMGTLSALASRQGLETILVTGDSDTLQLVADDVHVLMPRRTMGDVQHFDVAAVKERYGLLPGQLIDLKALMGDSSDNIPGVKGIGEKTATQLLVEYGSLDNVYEHLEEIRQKGIREKLRAGRDEALMSRHLVTIVRDLDVSLDLDAARWGVFDRQNLMGMMRRLGFHSLIDRLPGDSAAPAGQLSLFDAPPAPPAPGEPRLFGDYRIVDTPEALNALVERMSAAPVFGLDTETTSTDQMQARLVGISIATAERESWYIPVGHVQRPGERQLDLDVVAQAIGPILADETRNKVLHNAKYDMIVLERHGCSRPTGAASVCANRRFSVWRLR
jgi:DNA polymerase-1